MSDNPILNSPYEEPRLHYAQTADRSLDYEHVLKGRRVFDPKADRQPSPTRQSRQRAIPFVVEPEVEAQEHLINLVRKEVSNWRSLSYPETTRVTSELLRFWFLNPERENRHKLFFAQQESVETAIWLNEVAVKSNAGQNILRLIRKAQTSVSDKSDDQLPRTAFKMATGSGKTVVMACLILYHFANRQEYRSDTRFADYFLVVAPGVPVKDRLNVLFVDTRTQSENEAEDYYHVRRLIPKSLIDRLQGLNSKLVVTNYHTFLPKTLQGNKKSPFDGKVDLAGKKIRTDNKEDYSIVLKRVLSNFKTGSRLLILNDEAHHCYLPRGTDKTTDNEEVDENERAAVWFSGLREIAKKYKVHNIYDLSATPYYLNGSGYEPYSLFPWVVSDFGLIEAIESGLVKIPFLPSSDTSQEIEQPVLANLYEHVKEELPRKGQKKKKKEAKEEGDTLKQERPVIPALIKQALDMFYNHYDEYAKGQRDAAEVARNLFTPPPVFIIVCNNTSVSKEVYKYIAGYEFVDTNGDAKVVGGIKDHFNNYDANNRPKRKPPTLLIDSDALDNSDQINDDFKKVFADEIEIFKRDYTRIHGQGSAENITDAQILREVVNTVGQQRKLGEHIRCVVSVSMLTEGWDANTVTHIMGIRAFGSQLLCEQVAGRALRRMDYTLQGYDQAGNRTDSKAKDVIYKFPPEYAHIIGVPFKLFKGGKAGLPPSRVDENHVKALAERKDEFEITFPNVIGYRIDNNADEITCDFSGIETFDIDGTKQPVETTMSVAVAARQEKLEVKDVLEKRNSEIHYLITKELIRHKFSDVDENPDFRKFGRLKDIVAQWYEEKLRLIGIRDEKYKKLVFFQDTKKIVEHIYRGINTHLNTTEFVRPVFNHYNRFGSTKYVNGSTTKPVFETERSHVNYVVEDSTWEAKAAKTLDELKVISYVKNSFLEFKIPYIRDAIERDYYPDFIIRVNGKDGTPKNLILEVTGMNKDKAEKKWYVENRWLPAVNSVREKFGYDEWHFIEVKEDIRDISNELIDKIESI